MNNVCPRCRTQALVPRCGGGAECLTCDYETGDDLDVYTETMTAVPGAPLPARSERHGVEVRRARDITLAEEAAKRHGVSLRDVWADMRYSKSISGSIRFALPAIIADLTVAGLGSHRIALVLRRSTTTIKESPGLARGRRMRENHD